MSFGSIAIMFTDGFFFVWWRFHLHLWTAYFLSSCNLWIMPVNDEVPPEDPKFTSILYCFPILVPCAFLQIPWIIWYYNCRRVFIISQSGTLFWNCSTTYKCLFADWTSASPRCSFYTQSRYWPVANETVSHKIFQMLPFSITSSALCCPRPAVDFPFLIKLLKTSLNIWYMLY